MMDTKLPRPAPPETEPVNLADLIEKVSDGFRSLLASGLNRDAIVVLLHDETGVPRKQINAVLDGLGALKRNYTSK